jgi:hypothetical protein
MGRYTVYGALPNIQKIRCFGINSESQQATVSVEWLKKEGESAQAGIAETIYIRKMLD